MAEEVAKNQGVIIVLISKKNAPDLLENLLVHIPEKMILPFRHPSLFSTSDHFPVIDNFVCTIKSVRVE